MTVIVDERSAGFFAVGAAQASGEPVALLSTSGTAAANYHPAVCEADESALPLVVLTCAGGADPDDGGVDLCVGDVLPHPARKTAAAVSAPTHPATERAPIRPADIGWFLPVAQTPSG